jgi:hypothetical protein
MAALRETNRRRESGRTGSDHDGAPRRHASPPRWRRTKRQRRARFFALEALFATVNRRLAAPARFVFRV